MNRRLHILGLFLLAGLFSFSLLGCEDDDDDNNNGSGNGLVGIWRQTVAGVEEETIQMESDGSLTWVIADLALEDCMSMDGTWDADADSITTTVGVISSTVAYTVSANTLTIVDEDGEEFVYSRIGAMIDCDHYGFGGGGGTMGVMVNGTAYDLGAFASAVIDGGNMMIVGGDLTRQIVLSLDGITAGTYNLNTGQNMGSYVPLITAPADMYVASLGMGSGQVVITSVANNTVQGTFSFTGQHLSSIATVAVTNGQFSVPIE